jgi:hypothetical protein
MTYAEMKEAIARAHPRACADLRAQLYAVGGGGPLAPRFNRRVELGGVVIREAAGSVHGVELDRARTACLGSICRGLTLRPTDDLCRDERGDRPGVVGKGVSD